MPPRDKAMTSNHKSNKKKQVSIQSFFQSTSKPGKRPVAPGNDTDDDNDEEDMHVPLSELVSHETAESPTKIPCGKRRKVNNPEVKDKVVPRDAQSSNESSLVEATPTKTPKVPPPSSAAVPVTTVSSSIRQAKVPSLRRIVSDSAMDYIPPTSPPSTVSLQEKLMQRSTTGCLLSRSSLQIQPIRRPPHEKMAGESAGATAAMDDEPSTKKQLPRKPRPHPSLFRKSKWVQLESIANASPSASQITDMAWDTDGILLAVALTFHVLIYDWDTVRAAHLRGTQEDQRRSGKQSSNAKACLFQIPPLLEFETQLPIHSLAWNPYCPDQLAVGFAVTPELHLYPLDKILDWKTKQASRPPTAQQQRPRRYPPTHLYLKLKATISSSGASSQTSGTCTAIQFGDKHHSLIVMACLGSNVYGWKQDGTCLWRYSASHPCTCLQWIPNASFVWVGMSSGQLVLLDTARVQRRSAFSLQDRPEVVYEWSCKSGLCRLQVTEQPLQLQWSTAQGWVGQTLMTLEKNSRDRNKEMSRQLQNRSNPSERLSFKAGIGLSQRKKSTAVPSLSSDYNIYMGPTQILYSPRKVEVFNAKGESIGQDPKAHSLPSQPLSSWGLPASNLLAFPQVPLMSKYLGHHDKYMVDHQPKIVQSPERNLELLQILPTGENQEMARIVLPIKDFPQSMALHPSLEWMVLGIGKELALMTTNRKSF